MRMPSNGSSPVSVSLEMNAPPAAVWGLVADITRMGDWSPETESCKWLRGADKAAVGAKFKGHNVNGRYSWDTVATVTDCEEGRSFAFESKSAGLAISRWEYTIHPTDTGCTVTETWTDQRGWLVGRLSPRVSGVADRATHNASTMQATLERVAAAAEASTAP